MARKQLINLHSTAVKNPSASTIQPEIAVGEIVVQAVKSAPVIYTKVYDSTKEGDAAYSFAEFIDKAKVETLIAGVSSDVTELSGNVGTLSSETKTLESHFEAAVSGIGYTASSIANYIERQGFAKDTDLQTLSGTVTNALSEMQIDATHSVKTYVDNEIDSEESERKDEDSRLNNLITGLSEDFTNAVSGIGKEQGSIANYIQAQGFAKDSDLQTLSGTVNTLNTNFTNVTSGFSGQNAIKNAIDSEANARTTEDTRLNNVITALSQNFDYAVDGLTINSTHSVKSYVDGQVSQAISSVYRVKGSVATYEGLPTTGLTVGDVYNVVAEATVGGKWYPAGTNWVYNESHVWDPLGGTIDLTPYALKTDLQSEAASRTSVDKEINDKIGGSYSSSSTVADAISAARTSADDSLKSITGTGSDYLTVTIDAVAGEAGAKSQKFSAVPEVAASIDSVQSTDKKLADAYQVKSKFESINTDITTLSQAFSAESAYTYNEIAKVLTGISASGDEYVTAQASQKDNHAQSITVAADVAGALGSISATGKLADAKHVQDYVNNKYNDATSRTDKVASDLAELQAIVGDNTGYTAQYTITDALAALESDAVETITVKNTNTNLITVSKTGNNVEFDFDNMVVDCGEY